MLVATGPVDPTADLVITELNHRGIPCARIDPGAFPHDVTLDATLSRDGVWHGHLGQGRSRVGGDLRSSVERACGFPCRW